MRVKFISVLYVLILASSMYGVFLMIGIQSSTLKLFYIGLPLFLVLFIFYKQQGVFFAPFLIPFLLYSATVFISALVNNEFNIEVFSFYHYTFISYLVLLCGANLNLTRYIDRINNIFVFLIGLQFFATVIKLIVLGRQEGVIGTMSLTTGSLNTFYPLLAMAFLISLYIFVKPNKIYILLMALLLIIPYAGEKRGFIFFLPIFIFYLLYLYNIKILHRKIPTKLYLVGMILSITIFYLGAMSNKTLNISELEFGGVDLGLMYDYVVKYNYRYMDDGLVVGRAAGLIQALNYTISNDGYTMLFGSGPDSLIGYSSRDGTEEQFGIRNSGSINGLATYLISVGILGTVFYLAFFLSILKKLFKIVKYSKHANSPLFFSITSIILFLMDFLIYSRTFSHSHVFAVWVFFYIGYAIRTSMITSKS
jgi:hypothetical protein